MKSRVFVAETEANQVAFSVLEQALKLSKKGLPSCEGSLGSRSSQEFFTPCATPEVVDLYVESPAHAPEVVAKATSLETKQSCIDEVKIGKALVGGSALLMCMAGVVLLTSTQAHIPVLLTIVAFNPPLLFGLLFGILLVGGGLTFSDKCKAAVQEKAESFAESAVIPAT